MDVGGLDMPFDTVTAPPRHGFANVLPSAVTLAGTAIPIGPYFATSGTSVLITSAPENCGTSFFRKTSCSRTAGAVAGLGAGVAETHWGGRMRAAARRAPQLREKEQCAFEIDSG